MRHFDVYGVVDAGRRLEMQLTPRKFDENPVIRGVATGLIYEFVVPREENPEVNRIVAQLSKLLHAPVESRRFL